MQAYSVMSRTTRACTADEKSCVFCGLMAYWGYSRYFSTTWVNAYVFFCFQASPKEPAHCQERLDGVYADHSSDCQDYYVCKSGQQSKKSCPENQRFSALRNACMPSKEVVCIPPSTDMVGVSSVNSLRPRQNGRHFTDDTFKRIFLNENVLISIKISLKFVPKGQINNIPALVQIMAWCRPGDKPLSEPRMVSLPTHICVTRPQ